MDPGRLTSSQQAGVSVMDRGRSGKSSDSESRSLHLAGPQIRRRNRKRNRDTRLLRLERGERRRTVRIAPQWRRRRGWLGGPLTEISCCRTFGLNGIYCTSSKPLTLRDQLPHRFTPSLAARWGFCRVWSIVEGAAARRCAGGYRRDCTDQLAMRDSERERETERDRQSERQRGGGGHRKVSRCD